MEEKYHPQPIEAAAQQYWEDNQSFRVTEDRSLEKYYCLSMFPYPSGRLHMGHVRNYTIGDVISRYQRMLGKNVLQPMGWDAFGLPAENAAIQGTQSPAEWTKTNIQYMKRQMHALGLSYDWDRELATCDVNYYRWEQWLFVRLLEKGLAYRKRAKVNWDPVDQTVLANEQVIDGRGWRSGALVEQREIEQWFLKITDYAKELLEQLEQLSGWPQSVITMQRNWIGQSQGVVVDFQVNDLTLSVFTTRPDTLMGVTYLALAAEHPLTQAVAKHHPGVASFIDECQMGRVCEADRQTIEKRGIALDRQATHPITGELIPVYAANFVLMEYGSGAVMAVPAHDQRDWEFAKKYQIPCRCVIVPSGESECDISQAAYVEKGVLINSGQFDGLSSDEAFEAIAIYLQKHDKGSKQIHYRLRDWGVSRQRYWGCPIPVIKTRHGMQAEERLPVELPLGLMVNGAESPLKQLPAFYDLGDGRQRDTDTFDTFVESSWYFARYCCPDADEQMLDERARYWLPVDQYVGGVEHAVLHLLYARFFNKLMRDEGLIDNDEPFTRLLTQGMVMSETWYRQDAKGHKTWFNPSDVTTQKDVKGKVITARLQADGKPVLFGGIEKMSKSKNNGVDPQQLIERYGADVVRLYTLFAAPPEQSLEWSDEGLAGADRFIHKLWRIGIAQRSPVEKAVVLRPDNTPQRKARQAIHGILDQALFDYQRQQFNTVISASMKMINTVIQLREGLNQYTDEQSLDYRETCAVISEAYAIVLRLLAPIIPHITHYLWKAGGWGEDILQAPWPRVDPSALVQELLTMAVQVQGKLRGEIVVPVDADRHAICQIALQNPNVERLTQGKVITKTIVVPGKLINILTKQATATDKTEAAQTAQTAQTAKKAENTDGGELNCKQAIPDSPDTTTQGQTAIQLLIPDMPRREALSDYLRQIDDNRWYSNFGPLLQQYEQALAHWFNERGTYQSHVVTVNSGMAALTLGLSALGMTPGARVLLPAIGFVACAHAVIQLGCRPVFTDVDQASWLLTPDIARQVMNHTKIDAVMPVASFGVSHDVKQWDQFTADTGIPVLIDAAGALAGQDIGQTTLCAYSLHATKPFGVGEGGLIVGHDQQQIADIRRCSNFGLRDGVAWDRYATNAKLSEYHAAVGLAQLQRRSVITKNYYQRVAWYRILLDRLSDQVVMQSGWGEQISFQLPVRIDRPTTSIQAYFQQVAIACRSWYGPPLYQHPAFVTYDRVNTDGTQQLTVSQQLSRHLLGLPFYTQITQQDINSVVRHLEWALG